MNEAKQTALVGMLQYQVGLSQDDAQEVLALVESKTGASGGVVPPSPPGVPGPEVLIHPGVHVISKDQAKLFGDMAAPLPPSAESGWGSRKLWVAVATLIGMLGQLPLDKRLSPPELIAVACVAVAYLVMQGLVDIAKVHAR